MTPNATIRTATVRSLKNAPAGYLDFMLTEPSIAAAARPGQFVMLRSALSTDPLLPRPFDIADIRPEEGAFRLIIKVVGGATRLLESLRPGDSVRVTGPLGAPIEDFGFSSLALLVRGCGAAAVLLFLREAKRRGIVIHTVLSASTSAKLILLEELTALSDSLTVATDDGSAGEKALGSEVLRRVLLRTKVDRVYSCGGGPFYQPFLDELEKEKAAPVYIFLESYMACGFGHCHGCAVPRRAGGYALVCREGPLFKLSEVKETCLTYQ